MPTGIGMKQINKLSDTLFGRINFRTVAILFKKHQYSYKFAEGGAGTRTRVTDSGQLFANDNVVFVHDDD